MGELNKREKQYDQAIIFYNWAIETKPQTFSVEGKIVETCTAELHCKLGDCYVDQARHAEEEAKHRIAAGGVTNKQPIITQVK